MNVVYALNANENRVPYRESKLTRMLQDSLGGANFVLMLTCPNPVLWQNTMYTLSLTSRSCQSISRVMDSTIKSKSSAKPLVPSSFKCGKSASLFKSGKFTTVSATIKKEMTRSRVHLHDKKPSSMVKGRKLFDDGKDMISSEQDISISDVSPTTTPKKDETLLASAVREAEPTIEEEEGTFFSSAIKETELTTKDDKDGFQCTESNHVEVTSGCGMGKEIKTLMNEDGSPPLRVRLQELSNNMKSLYSSTPLCVERPQRVDISGQAVCTDLLEPKTPVVEEDVRVNDKWQVVNYSSRLTTYKVSCSQLPSVSTLCFQGRAERYKGYRGEKSHLHS